MGKLVNRCKMTVSGIPGAGAITLGSAATGFLAFTTAGVVDQDVISYLCEDGAAWEYGQGTYTASGATLARTTVIYSSSGAATAISLSASATVTVVPQAADILSTATSNAYTFAQQTQARSNLSAAALEAGSYLGICVNPFMEISQENGMTSFSFTGQSKYAADQNYSTLTTAGAGTATAQQIADPFSSTASYRRFRNAVRVTVGTAQASLGAGDYFNPVTQNIEGNFWKGMGWGTADAASVDVVAIVSASVTGTYSLAVRNYNSTRSYLVPVVLTANTPTVVFATIPGDTSGTWVTDNTASMSIWFVAGSGSTYQAPTNNAWQSGNYVAVNGGGTNLAATAGATFTIAYMNIFPTGVLPYTSAAQVDLTHLANMRRPYDDELRRCQRYYAKTTATIRGNAQYMRTPVYFPAPMRVTPTGSLANGGGRSLVSTSTYQPLDEKSGSHDVASTTPGSDCYAIGELITLNARM